MNPKRFLLLLLTCLSFAAVAETGGAALPSPADAAGKIDLVEGDVHIYDKDSKARRVKVGDAIAEGESIVTRSDGELHIQMADGGYIAVRPNTKMRIAVFRADGSDDDKGIFGLLVGSFRSITGWIGKHNSRNYQVNTPTATIGIRGTDHEPLVIPEGSKDGEPGTYDKVNSGGSYIQTPHGRVEVAEHKSAFAPHAGTSPPRLLESIPHFFQPTHNEHLLEHRHDAIQHVLDRQRNERRQTVEQRKAGQNQAGEHHSTPGNQRRPDLRNEPRRQQRETLEDRQDRQERRDLRLLRQEEGQKQKLQGQRIKQAGMRQKHL